MTRIVLAGLFHETNTFAPGVTALDDFTQLRADAIFGLRGDASPMGGFLDLADEAGVEVRPVIDLRAFPGPMVDDAVVDCFVEAVLEALRADPGDGLFLVLHGAMVSVSHRDVEGHILGCIRGQMGANYPIFGVYDLHANFSLAMAREASGLIAYRKNPHTDAREAARDAGRLMLDSLREGFACRMSLRQLPILLTPAQTGTADALMRELEAAAREIERSDSGIVAMNINAAFAYADTQDTALSFSAIYRDGADADAAFDRLERVLGATGLPANPVPPSTTDALGEIPETGEGPFLLVEDADNIGGGSPGDGVTLLAELMSAGVSDAAVAINAPEVVAGLSVAKPGDTVSFVLPGMGADFEEAPLPICGVLRFKSGGRFKLEDSQSHLASISGSFWEMGPCAVVVSGGIEILLTSRKTPPMDLGMWRSQGIEPTEKRIMGIKAAVSHRRAFDTIARGECHVDTPGPCSNRLERFNFSQLRRPIHPLDPQAYTTQSSQL